MSDLLQSIGSLLWACTKGASFAGGLIAFCAALVVVLDYFGIEL